MMRRIKLVFLLLVMLGAAVYAEGTETLPRAVIDLCAQVHPGYAIAAHDGWGGEDRGQYALILRQGDDNILCMAEKAAEDLAYQLTIDNTNAVYDGDLLPSLMIDSGGDSLWYTYYDESGRSLHLHTIKQGGMWIEMDVALYETQGEDNRTVLSGVWNERLHYQVDYEDENGNILSSDDFESIPVSDAFIERMLPQHFDINTYTADPEYGIHPAMLPGLAQGLIEEEDTLIDLDLKKDGMALAVQKADGTYRVRFARDYGGGYSIVESGDVGASLSFDALHADEDQIILQINGFGNCIFERDSYTRTWLLRYTYADEGVNYGYDCVAPYNVGGVSRNDGYVYGTAPGRELRLVDFSGLPRSYAQALESIDQSAYVLVNNPNPADRLHLREKPEKSAYSYGKFYNRTPVQVLERGEIWTKVRIGSESDGLTGYMMTEYLAFDENEKAQLACAFPQMQLTEDYWESGVTLLAEPSYSADGCGMFENQREEYIIGVSGDEWYIVLRADGAAGYVPQSAFWAGNG